MSWVEGKKLWAGGTAGPVSSAESDIRRPAKERKKENKIKVFTISVILFHLSLTPLPLIMCSFIPFCFLLEDIGGVILKDELVAELRSDVAVNSSAVVCGRRLLVGLEADDEEEAE